MSFRKRNVGIAGTQAASPSAGLGNTPLPQASGVRPSAIDGRPTTSTGTLSLDGLLAGHAGLALGTSILIEESGATDYAGVLLRFYAAEGLVQGHHVHVVGLPEQWGRELPGVVAASDKQDKRVSAGSDKMKIAWRYEHLNQFGSDNLTRERTVSNDSQPQSDGAQKAHPSTFCHTFDLTKRLVHPPSAQIDFIMLDSHPSRSPFDVVIDKLRSKLTTSQSNVVHRVVIPSLLSPALYPPHACLPQHVLKFQQNLRALLASHSSRLTVMQSLPLSLYPSSSGFTRWLELLNDGVFELTPFPHSAEADFQATRSPDTKEEPPQGMLKVRRIPIFHDRGSGIPPSDIDWTFTLSRRKITIKPFNLPPVGGDTDAQQGAGTKAEQKPKKEDLEF